MSVRAYHRPTSLAEALRLKAACPGSRYIAGGTDLMVLLRAGGEGPEVLISLRGIGELHGISANGTGPDGHTSIGALTTVADLLADAGIAERYPVLRDAARPFGSVQIRNLASLGGNLCHASPGADLPPALLVLDARVRLAGPRGEREMPLDEFFLGPGETRREPDEVLAAVLLDAPPAGARSRYLRKSRVRMDLAIVGVAVLLVLDGDRCTRARVAAGAVGPRPMRLRAVEKLLEGRRLEPELVAEARARAEGDVSPITDLRASATYRRRLTGVLLQRAVASLLDGEPS